MQPRAHTGRDRDLRAAGTGKLKNHGHFYVFADKALAGLSSTVKCLESTAALFVNPSLIFRSGP